MTRQNLSGKRFKSSTTGDSVLESYITTDSTPRFVLSADGDMAWGPGSGGMATTFGFDGSSGLTMYAPNGFSTSHAFFAETVDGTLGVSENGVSVLLEECFTFSRAGALVVGAGTFRIYIDGGSFTIIKTRMSLGVAPTGSSAIVDINKNGTTIFSTQSNRPAVFASAFTGTSVLMSTTSLTTGDYLTVDIDQKGSSVAGSDLTVQIWVQRV